MKERIFNISKRDVYEEVARTASYTGAKMVESPEESHERISLVDEDIEQMGRFWDETVAELCQELKSLLGGMTATDGGMVLTLELSESFDDALLASMAMSLKSYFVQSISSKWFVYTNKGESGAYKDNSMLMLEDFKQKAYYKKRPVRPVYNR